MSEFYDKLSGDRPRVDHPNPWLRIVSKQEEFDQVKKEIAEQKKSNLQLDRVPKKILSSLKWTSIPVTALDLKPFDKDLYFIANSSNDVILPHHRNYWQYDQKTFWMYCSSGYAVFVEDATKTTYLILILRSATAYNHTYKLDLFNGAPYWEKSKESVLSKEIICEKSTAKKRLVERLFMYDINTKESLLPNFLLSDDFTDSDVKKCFASCNNMVQKIAPGKFPTKTVDKYLESRFVPLNGTCTMNLIFKNGSGDHKIYDERRNVLPVFGTDYDGKTQNLDSLQAIKIYFNGKIQDLALVYGDEEEITGNPLDYTIVAVKCDDKNKPNLPFEYEVIWSSGERYDMLSDLASMKPEISQALREEKKTPVTCALLDSYGCKIGIPKRSQKDK